MLLIGETGVGKSAWINAFANYCSFDTLDQAEEAGGKFPIPSTIQISHEQMDGLINISSECTGLIPFSQVVAVGESITQMPDEYIFQYQNTKIVIIDTPGLLDTKDVGRNTHATDKEHVNDILRLLSAYNEIHAICIVLKANETRLSAAFTYVISEILKHLNRTASNNVIFFLTNAGTRFKSEKTQALLQKFLSENDLTIPLPPSKATVYCFESDPVEYLVKRRNRIPLEEDEKEDTTKHWSRSKDSTAEAIRYVFSLDPLSLDGINAIYDAQCTIGILSKLVLETLQCVADNVKKLESKKAEAEQMQAEIRISPTKFQQVSIRKAMVVDIKRIVRTELGYTNIVCGARKCVDVVGGELVYTKICCRNCNSWYMWVCENMYFWGSCKCCGCRKSEHEWTRTESKVVTDKVHLVQENVGGAAEAGHAIQIVASDSAVEDLNRAIYECKNQVKMYKQETEHMLRTCAKLNTFVTQNPLMASSDVDKMTMNLENRIVNYERAIPGKGLTDLKQIRLQYNQYLGEEKFKHYTPSDVHDLIQELYTLPMNGNDLKEAMEVEETARRKVANVKRKANPVMVHESFCEQFISKVKPSASRPYRKF